MIPKFGPRSSDPRRHSVSRYPSRDAFSCSVVLRLLGVSLPGSKVELRDTRISLRNPRPCFFLGWVPLFPFSLVLIPVTLNWSVPHWPHRQMLLLFLCWPLARNDRDLSLVPFTLSIRRGEDEETRQQGNRFGFATNGSSGTSETPLRCLQLHFLGDICQTGRRVRPSLVR